MNTNINLKKIKSICTYISKAGTIPKAPDEQNYVKQLQTNGCIYLGHAISAIPKFESDEHTNRSYIPIEKMEEIEKWYINRDKLQEIYGIKIEY